MSMEDLRTACNHPYRKLRAIQFYHRNKSIRNQRIIHVSNI